jgi:hypothetical protein
VWKVVAPDPEFPGVSNVSVFGCALSVRIPRLLAQGTQIASTNASFDVRSTALAGSDVALITHMFDKEVGVLDGVTVADVRTGHVLNTSLDLCDNFLLGCTVVDALQVNDHGFAAWHQWFGTGYPPSAHMQEQVVVADDGGIRAVDTVSPGDGHTLTNVVLGPDSVTWDNAGVRHSAALQ